MTQNDLEKAVCQQLEQYFLDLGEQQPRDILPMVISCVEKPVLKLVLQKSNGNQTRAAEMLGITRATLRRKLAQYSIKP